MNQLLKISAALVLAGGIALGAHSVVSAGASGTAQAKVMSEYKGVKLGMKREDVKSVMGNPSSSTGATDDFKLTGDDTMTVHYENGEVKAIQLAFFNPERAPAWQDVVGDAEVNELSNGAKTARKTLETEKFWVSIYQTKDKSSTRITISR